MIIRLTRRIDPTDEMTDAPQWYNSDYIRTFWLDGDVTMVDLMQTDSELPYHAVTETPEHIMGVLNGRIVQHLKPTKDSM